MVKICPNCGAKASDEDNFCQECGAPLTEVATSKTMGAPVSMTGSGGKSTYEFVKLCPKCGARAEADAMYCPNCEAELENVQPVYIDQNGNPAPAMGVGTPAATSASGFASTPSQGSMPAQGISGTGSGMVQNMANVKQFKVVQKMFSLRPIYIVKDMQDTELMIIKQSLFSFFGARLSVETKGGEKLGEVSSNFFRTKWEVKDTNGMVKAIIEFPFISFFGKTFKIILPNGMTFDAGRSFAHRHFRITTPDGRVAFEVNKKFFSLRDTFQVLSYGILDDITTLATVACIDLKYHQGD